MNKDIFICYSYEDKEIVFSLVEEFKKVEITYWHDLEEIKWGESLSKKISDGLKYSKFVLVILSSNSIKKHWQKVEINASFHREVIDNKVRVLPLIVGNNKEVEYILSEFPLLSDKSYLQWKNNSKEISYTLKGRIEGITLNQYKNNNKIKYINIFLYTVGILLLILIIIYYSDLIQSKDKWEEEIIPSWIQEVMVPKKLLLNSSYELENRDFLLMGTVHETKKTSRIYTLKFDSRGNRVYDKILYSAGNINIKSAVLKKDKSIAIVSEDRTYDSANWHQRSIKEFDLDGKLIWNRSFSNYSRNSGYNSINIMPKGEIITLHTDDNLKTGILEAYVTLWNKDNNERWKTKLKNSEDISGRKLLINNAGRIFVIGETRNLSYKIYMLSETGKVLDNFIVNRDNFFKMSSAAIDDLNNIFILGTTYSDSNSDDKRKFKMLILGINDQGKKFLEKEINLGKSVASRDIILYGNNIAISGIIENDNDTDSVVMVITKKGVTIFEKFFENDTENESPGILMETSTNSLLVANILNLDHIWKLRIDNIPKNEINIGLNK